MFDLLRPRKPHEAVKDILGATVLEFREQTRPKGHIRAEVRLVPLEAKHAGKIKDKVTLSVLLLNFYIFVIFNNY
jgi:hypothetical protein